MLLANQRILLGPGRGLMSPRVMQALGRPMPASLIYALREALAGVEEEGLHARWARHQKLHEAFVTALDRLNLALLPAPGERLWKLNAVAVPEGVDDGLCAVTCCKTSPSRLAPV